MITQTFSWRNLAQAKQIRYFLFLDLSDCQLQQVPDAIFMLMQNTSLVSCNLSHNVINKIPAKLAIKWTLLTGNDSFYGMTPYILWRNMWIGIFKVRTFG